MQTENEVKLTNNVDDMLFKEVRERLYLLKKQVFLTPTKENVMELKRYRTLIKEKLDL